MDATIFHLKNSQKKDVRSLNVGCQFTLVDQHLASTRLTSLLMRCWGKKSITHARICGAHALVKMPQMAARVAVSVSGKGYLRGFVTA
jgi:hypothetical protein